jgi:phosphatidylserine/phosphatidylglycerophosphate/cardiolipin synthase-like enzyme
LRTPLLVLILLLAAGPACRSTVGPEPAQTAPATAAADWYSVYFTDPTGPNSSSLRGGPDASLARAIDAAQISVETAVLQLDLWSVRDALLAAHRRGVQVRLVVESDYRNSPELQTLAKAGIPVLGDRREGLMHNKFTVIDRREVWTGSMNYTVTDGYRNNNNLVRLRSRELAAAYLAEFEEMFSQDQFGPGSPANTPHPELVVEGTPISVCFSPDDGCAARLQALLSGARNTIHFLAFSFTSDPLGDAILDRVKAGVAASGVMEESQVRSNSGGEFERFRAGEVDVRPDANPRNMHHKLLMIDGRFVVTGSYNYSHFAETRNDENLIIIDSPEIAALYEAEFQRLFEQAEQ